MCDTKTLSMGIIDQNCLNFKATVKFTVLTENLVFLDQKSIFKLNLKDNQVASHNHAVSFIFKKEASDWIIIHGQESWNNN